MSNVYNNDKSHTLFVTLLEIVPKFDIKNCTYVYLRRIKLKILMNSLDESTNITVSFYARKCLDVRRFTLFLHRRT